MMIKELHSELISKAERKELKELERKTITFVPYEDFRELQKSLDNYTKIESYQSLIKEVKNLQEMQGLSAHYDFVTNRIEQSEFKLNNKLFDFLKKDDFKSGINSLKLTMDSLNSSIICNKTEIDEINDKIKLVNVALAKKLETHHLTGATVKIWNKVKTLASTKDFEDMKEYVMPTIDFMKLRIASFAEDINRNQEIIRRFDEIILQKASKFSLDEIDKKFDSYFKISEHNKYEKNLQRLIEDINTRINEFDNKLKYFRETSFDDLNNQMNAVLYKLRKEIIDSYGGHPVDAREVDAKLSLKADYKELDSLRDIIVEKFEYNQALDQLRQIRKQITQSLLVLIGYMRDITLSQNEPQTHQKSATTVMNQLQSVLNVERKQNKEISTWDEASNKLINMYASKRNSVGAIERRSKNFKLNTKTRLHINIPQSRERIRNHGLNVTHDGRSLKSSPNRDGLLREIQRTERRNHVEIKLSKYFTNKLKNHSISNHTIQADNEKSFTITN